MVLDPFHSPLAHLIRMAGLLGSSHGIVRARRPNERIFLAQFLFDPD